MRVIYTEYESHGRRKELTGEVVHWMNNLHQSASSSPALAIIKTDDGKLVTRDVYDLKVIETPNVACVDVATLIDTHLSSKIMPNTWYAADLIRLSQEIIDMFKEKKS